jgi:hypothetical protein
MDRRTAGVSLVIVGLLFAVAACTSAATPGSGTTSPGAGTTSPEPGGTPAGGGQGTGSGSGNAANGYEGSLVTSGLYDASWSVSPEQAAEPFNSVGARTLTSDKGTYGNVSVALDGSVSFGSGAPELSQHGLEFAGSGAQTTLDASGAFVCAFTVDTDLTAGDGSTLHVAGTMTVHWHPEGLGDISCP